MKIDSSITKTVATPSGDPKVAPRPGNKPKEGEETGKGDSVQLSSPSHLHAMGSMNEGAPVDSAKIEAIKQAIAEGRFKINPEMIADRLLNSVQDLLTNRKV